MKKNIASFVQQNHFAFEEFDQSQIAQIAAVMQNVPTAPVKETPVEQIVVPMNIAPVPAPVIVQPIPTPAPVFVAPVIPVEAPTVFAPQIVQTIPTPVIQAPAPVFAPSIVEAPVIPGLSLPILPSLP
jgi:hypothetical protein